MRIPRSRHPNTCEENIPAPIYHSGPDQGVLHLRVQRVPFSYVAMKDSLVGMCLIEDDEFAAFVVDPDASRGGGCNLDRVVECVLTIDRPPADSRAGADQHGVFRGWFKLIASHRTDGALATKRLVQRSHLVGGALR